MLFQRLEENCDGVPDEEFTVPDVTSPHGVRGVTGLLSDLERGDARPSGACREASAQAVLFESADKKQRMRAFLERRRRNHQ